MPCPLCKVDHGGPCPKLPTPPKKPELQKLTGWLPDKPQGRARSNALTPDDPRLPSAELQMKIALSQPATMAPTLQDFVLKVFRDAELMKGEDGVAGRIYNLYSSGEGGGGDLPRVQQAKQFFVDVWQLRGKYPPLEKGALQYTKVSLKNMASFCAQPENIPASKYFTDFLYFNVGGNPACRLYLNVKLASIPAILGHVCEYMGKQKDHGISAFKCACPYAAPGRADSIVVYCVSKGAAEKLGRHMLTFADSYNPGVPGMTTRLDPRLGVAIGAEPEWQATGMDKNPDGYPESAQSFGSIRSQLIAMAILNYNANSGSYGTGFDVFKRFVCAAFRGYGLNPMQPGD